jgi:lysophospholipase L1-like esterase
MFSLFDPFCGYDYANADLPDRDDEQKKAGFSVYKTPGSSPSIANQIRIVTLGNSTTTPHFAECWPKQLLRIFKAEGLNVKIYNGGVSGYTSAQELLKLVRDVLPLKPDIVISYSGIRDIGFFHSIPGHPFINKFLSRTLSSLPISSFKTKTGKDTISGINYGTRSNTTPHENWCANIRMMNAISKEFKIKFYSILQPTLGIGNYTLSCLERDMLQKFDLSFHNEYMSELNSFYNATRKFAEKTDFITDLVDVFAGHSDIYYDCRHPNGAGYEIVAKHIRSVIKL